MDSNEYPKTLHQTADRHLVALCADYTPNKTAFTHAELTANGVEVVRFTMDFALNNRLTAAEMDALCKAWTAWREAQRLAAEAAEKEAWDAYEKAGEQQHPVIRIETDNGIIA